MYGHFIITIYAPLRLLSCFFNFWHYHPYIFNILVKCFLHLYVHVSLYTVNNYVTPSVHLPGSPFQVQETDQIVVRAEIRSPTAHVSSTWHHGDTSYSQPLKEDPFCNPDVEVSILTYFLCRFFSRLRPCTFYGKASGFNNNCI